MQTHTLIALTPLVRRGKAIAEGEVFRTGHWDALAIIAKGLAKAADDAPAEPTPRTYRTADLTSTTKEPVNDEPQKRKRTYKRRDMQAEEP